MTTPPLEARTMKPCARGRCSRGAGFGDVDLVGGRRRLGFDLFGRFVLAKALECGLPDHARRR